MRIFKNYTNKKVLISGRFIEEYLYQTESLGYGEFEDSAKKNFYDSTTGQLIERKSTYDPSEGVRATIKRFRRLVDSNDNRYLKKTTTARRTYFPSVFFTLTYRDNITDLRLAKYDFNLFSKRLNRFFTLTGNDSQKLRTLSNLSSTQLLQNESYSLSSPSLSNSGAHLESHQLQYVATTELQQRGAVHFHIMYFNLPYIKHSTLADLWGKGFVWVKRIDQVQAKSLYMIKYLTKSIEWAEPKKKKYLSSKNLYKSVIIKNESSVKDFMNSFRGKDIKQLSSKEYSTKFQGTITYNIYKTNNLNHLDILPFLALQ
jgi:hypothetical protein